MKLAAALLLVASCHGSAGSSDPSRVRVVEGAIEAEVLLAAQVEGARAAGASGLDVVGAEVLSEGEQLGSFVEIPEASCLLALVSPGESLGDVDLFVYSDEGDRLAADEAPSGRAAALVCPPHPGRVYVTARAMSGSGIVALGVMQVAPEKADGVARAVEVRGRPGEDTGKLAAWPGLERKIRERRERLGGQWEDLRRVALPVDPRAESVMSVVVEGDRCLDLFVVPNDDVPAIDVHLLDSDGRVIGYARPPGRDRAMVVCGAARESLTLFVRPRGGSGLVAVVVARSAAGAHRQLTEKATFVAASAVQPLDQAVTAQKKRLEALALGGTELFRAEPAPGTPISRPVTLERGCTRFDLVAGTPLGSFAASLWGPDGALLSEARGGAAATLFGCAAKRLEARLEIHVEEGAGPVAVLSGHHGAAPPVLLAHPAAAARLLSRFDDAVGPVGSKDFASVEVVAIEPERRTPIELSIDDCLEVVAAVEGAAQGIELRVESDADEEIDRLRGHGVVGQRICASEGAARITLRSSDRATSALLARLPSPR